MHVYQSRVHVEQSRVYVEQSRVYVEDLCEEGEDSLELALEPGDALADGEQGQEPG